MSELSITNATSAAGHMPVGRTQPSVRHARPAEAPVRRDADRVEVSREAREAAPRAETIRRDLVDRVRRELADGTYENDEKLNLAIEHLIAKNIDIQA